MSGTNRAGRDLHKKAREKLRKQDVTKSVLSSDNYTDTEKSMAVLNRIWRSFYYDDGREYNLACDLKKNTISDFVDNETRKTVEVKLSGLSSCDFFSDLEKGNIESFSKKITYYGFPADFFDSLIDRNEKFLRNPMTLDGCSPLASICSGIFNFVLLGGRERCWLVQHHKFVRAIYFPLKRVIVTLDKQNEPFPIYALKGLMVECMNNRVALKALIDSGSAKLGGIIAYYPRPFHFFYDLMPITKILTESAPRLLDFKVQSVSGQLFFPFKQAFGFREEVVSSESEINKRALSEGLFYIRPGLQERGREAFVEPLDDYLTKLSLQEVAENGGPFNSKLERFKKLDFVIWIGACAEKRSWLEQFDAVDKILLELSLSSNANIGVVFDGITASIDEYELEVKQKKGAGDSEFVQRIVQKYADKFDIVDLVGAKSFVKIAFASLTSFYFCNAGTDSMYPARFGRKTGVCHGSNAMRYGMHRHYRTIFVPSVFVKDLGSVDNINEARISYSIDPDRVADLVLCEIGKAFEVSNVSVIRDQLYFPKGVKAEMEMQSDRIIVHNSHDSHFYCSMNDKNRSFDFAGDNPEKIDCGKIYSFYFHGFQSGNLKCSLFIIGHCANGNRVYSNSMRPGSRLEIRFPKDTVTFRYFLRFNGVGKFTFWKIGFTTHTIDLENTVSRTSKLHAPRCWLGISPRCNNRN